MARTREFDVDKVLSLAMQTFWEKGYAATSISDLMAATGLAKGSLYKAFNDKHQLFLQALDFYLTNTKKDYRASLAKGESVCQQITQWVNDNAHTASEKGAAKNGCMAINSGIEMSQTYPDVQKRLEAHRAYVFKLLVEKVKEGQQQGELRNDLAAEQQAALIGTLHMGINSGMGHAFNKEYALGMINALLTTLKA